MDEWQYGCLTDNSDTTAGASQDDAMCHTNSSAAKIFVNAMCKYIDPGTGTATYLDAEFDDLYVRNDIVVEDQIMSMGDTDTYIDFTGPDNILVVVGNVLMLDINEDAAQKYLWINGLQNDVDFVLGAATSAYAFQFFGSDGALEMSDDDVIHGCTTELSTNAFARFAKHSGTQGGLTIRGANDAADEGLILTAIASGAGAGTVYSRIGAYKINGTGVTDIDAADVAFQIRNNGTALTTWLGSGYVGIGCTPLSTLSIVGPFQYGARPAVSSLIQGEIHGGVYAGDTDAGFFRISTGGADHRSWIDLAGYNDTVDARRNIVFGTRSLERMRINEDGEVGIGVTEMDQMLHVGGNVLIDIGSSLHFKDAANVTHGMTAFLPTNVFGAIARYNTNGGILIEGLTDADTQCVTLLGINGAASPTAAAINFTAGKKDGAGWQSLAAGEKAFSFTSYSTEVATILGNGYLGIGAATPVSLTEIQGGLTTVGAVLTLGTKETTVVVNDVLGRINFYAPLEADGSDALLVGASIVAVAEDTFSATVNKTSLIFQTGASEAATTKAVLTSAGHFGIGTVSPDTLLHLAVDDAVDDVKTLLTLSHNDTTYGTYGKGVGINFVVDAYDGATYPAANLYCIAAEGDAGQVVGNVVIKANNMFDGSLLATITLGGFGTGNGSKLHSTVSIDTDADYKVDGTRVVSNRGAALTPQLTTVTHGAIGTPDYSVAFTNDGGWGFSSDDEGRTVMSVIANLQTRVTELESRLTTHGLISAPA